MKYSLDTNTCIHYINGRSTSIQQHIRQIPARDIVVCSVIRAELFFGAAKSHFAALTLARQQTFLRPYLSLPFDDDAACWNTDWPE